jgi:hypothetical protein
MILNTDDTISKNWDFIEKRLEMFSKDGIDLHPGSPCTPKAPSHSRCSTARGENSSLKRKRIAGTQSEGIFRTTEVIYRSRDIHPAATISPKAKLSVQPKDLANSPALKSAMGLSDSIVPFSNMQEGFHPQVSPSSNENLSDLEHLFPSTPKNIGPAPDRTTQAVKLEFPSSLTSVESGLATMVDPREPLPSEAVSADRGPSAIKQRLDNKERLRSILKTSTASSTGKWIAKSDTAVGQSEETHEPVRSPGTSKTGSRRQTFAGLDKEIRATSSSTLATKLSPAHRANRNRAMKRSFGRNSRRKYSGLTFPFHHSNAVVTNRVQIATTIDSAASS